MLGDPRRAHHGVVVHGCDLCSKPTVFELCRVRRCHFVVFGDAFDGTFRHGRSGEIGCDGTLGIVVQASVAWFATPIEGLPHQTVWGDAESSI